MFFIIYQLKHLFLLFFEWGLGSKIINSGAWQILTYPLEINDLKFIVGISEISGNMLNLQPKSTTTFQGISTKDNCYFSWHIKAI